MTRRTVVVGGGLAAARCAEELRRLDPAREVVVLCAESVAPYDRPPLTKAYLRDGGAPPVYPIDWPTLGVELRLGARASGLDLDRGAVELDDGAAVPFDDLVIATGAVPRRLPGLDGRGVHTIRDLGDADRLRTDLDSTRSVTIVGAGFIGCEIASTARELGCAVRLVEALDAPLARVLGAEVGQRIGALHEANGVELHCAAPVVGVEGAGPERTLALGSGQSVPAAVTVVGLGVRPATDWLAGSRLAVADGVLCDAVGRTSHPAVWAAGDVARWDDPAGSEPVRQEHWTSAGTQGRTVAAAVLGRAAPVATVPYVWSDQLGTTIQLLGTPEPDDDVTVIPVAGDGRFVAAYGRAGRLSAVVGTGAPRLVMRQRAAVAEGADYADVAAKLTAAAAR